MAPRSFEVATRNPHEEIRFGQTQNPPRQNIVSITTIFSNIITNIDKTTTNGIYMNLGNYPHILQVTTRGNKLEIYLLIQSNYKWIKTV